MGNEELSTIPKKKSDELIKSSVEDRIPIQKESEDTFGSDSESVLPSSDDFSPIVLENIKSKDSYVSNLDEPALFVTPLSDANEDECFDPRGDTDEIDAFLDIDVSTDIENGYHDSEGDIIYLESLLIGDTIPNLPPEVFFDHDPRSLKDEHDNDFIYTTHPVVRIVVALNAGLTSGSWSGASDVDILLGGSGGGIESSEELKEVLPDVADEIGGGGMMYSMYILSGKAFSYRNSDELIVETRGRRT
ncbi:hypothetical protein Tco_0778694 [Tanacetum coccineum]